MRRDFASHAKNLRVIDAHVTQPHPARVLMLTNGIAPDQLGGLQRYVRELGAALVAQGVEVAILTRRLHADDPPHEIGADGVTIERHDVPPPTDPLYVARYPLAAARAVSARLRDLPGDTVVHVHFATAGLAAALRRRRYVQTFHAPIYKELSAERQDRYALAARLEPVAVAAVRAMETLVARRAQHHIVLSRFMASELERLAGLRAHDATVMPGGIDTEFFTPGDPVDHPFAHVDGPLLFTARRMVPRTGVAELVAAMPEIVRRRPDARLAIAGDGPLRPRIEADIERLGLHERVRLLGRVSEIDLLGWYRAADLFVLPTQELEGFGLSTAEALACGTPAVGTPVGATPELLGGLDQRLVAAGSQPRQIADAVAALLTDDDLLAEIAQRCRDHAHPRLGWPAVARRHLDLYAGREPAKPLQIPADPAPTARPRAR
jgi:glycosyltransferase involved in cell wall biosynthesis